MTVIKAEFDGLWFAHLFREIRAFGVNVVIERLVTVGYHPSFVMAAVKKTIREKGW